MRHDNTLLRTTGVYYFESLSIAERQAYEERQVQLADLVGDHLFLLLDALELLRATA